MSAILTVFGIGILAAIVLGALIAVQVSFFLDWRETRHRRDLALFLAVGASEIAIALIITGRVMQ